MDTEAINNMDKVMFDHIERRDQSYNIVHFPGYVEAPDSTSDSSVNP